MKQTKRLISIILSFAMLFSIMAGVDFSAYAKILTNGSYEYIILDDGTAKIKSYAGSGKDVSIPYSLGGYTVTNIGLSAFANAEITSITIPNTVTCISSSAFERCSKLSKAIIGNRVKTIEKDAFRNCISLKSITIPDSVTLIDNYAFADCDELANVTLSKNLSRINSCTFRGCNITNIVIPQNVTAIDPFAFEYCSNMVSVKIASKVDKIDDWAFYGCYKLKDVYYTGSKAQWENIFFGDNNELLTNANIHYNCDCKHSWKTTITKATAKKNGKIVKKCSVCGVTSTASIAYPKTITLSTTSYTYDGKAKKSSVTVKDSKGNKISASNYTVTYQSGRKNVGKYTVTIKFKGNYSGTVTKTFTIKPKATKLSKVTAGKKAFAVKWKKQATQTTGYQIQYSTDKNFKKNNKTVTVSKNSTTSKTISKLSAKKNYYVRIRTYKTVKVNGKSTKIYSSWSKSKTVKTK